jgi:long-chain acyl-CoA synthetase
MTTVLVLSVMKGQKMVLLPKFDAETTLKTIQKQRPTMFPGAPTIYIGLLNHPDIKKYDLSSIEACISGSAPLPVEVQQKFEEVTGGKLVEGYGLTESSPVTHSNFLWDRKRVQGRCSDCFRWDRRTSSARGNWGTCYQRPSSHEGLLEQEGRNG